MLHCACSRKQGPRCLCMVRGPIFLSLIVFLAGALLIHLAVLAFFIGQEMTSRGRSRADATGVPGDADDVRRWADQGPVTLLSAQGSNRKQVGKYVPGGKAAGVVLASDTASGSNVVTQHPLISDYVNSQRRERQKANSAAAAAPVPAAAARRPEDTVVLAAPSSREVTGTGAIYIAPTDPTERERRRERRRQNQIRKAKRASRQKEPSPPPSDADFLKYFQSLSHDRPKRHLAGNGDVAVASQTQPTRYLRVDSHLSGDSNSVIHPRGQRASLSAQPSRGPLLSAITQGQRRVAKETALSRETGRFDVVATLWEEYNLDHRTDEEWDPDDDMNVEQLIRAKH